MKMKLSKQETQTRAEFQPASFDSKKRTVDLVWSTGSRVKRYDWQRDTYYWEELVMDPANIRMERLMNGAPVLNNHSNWDLRDVIGVVERAELKDGKGEATVRFSQRDDVSGILQDVQDGILRNISVGYKVHKIERTNERIDDIPVYRVIDWEPLEVSLVGIPADSKSQIRNESDVYECEITNPGENEMGKRAKVVSAEAETQTRSEATPSETEASATPAQAEQTDAGQEAQTEGEQPSTTEGEQPSEEAARSESTSTPTSPTHEEIQAREMERQTEIRTAVRLANLGEDVADEMVKNPKMTSDEARKEIFKRLEAKEPVTNNQRFEVKDMDQKQVRKESATRALLHRFDGDKFEMKQGDGQFGQGSLLDVARNFLHAEGVKEAYTMSRTEVAKRALMASSDFPEVLANVANKSLRAGYEGVASTYKPFVGAPKTVSDFKEISSVVLGNGGKLEEVLESGEYKRTSIAESAEKYKIQKFGTIIGKTWELLVNDDLGAFTDVAHRMGVRSREKENEIFWSLVLANGTMKETGLSLFNAGHGNLVGAASISVAELGKARQSMRLMKDLEGELAGITPSYLVVPAALETVAEQFLAGIVPNQSSQVNPFTKSLQLIVEGRLDAASATQWYVMADAAKIKMAEMALLDGKGPEMFVREGFDVDGMELKIRYCFGMKLLDYRGFYRNG